MKKYLYILVGLTLLIPCCWGIFKAFQEVHDETKDGGLVASFEIPRLATVSTDGIDGFENAIKEHGGDSMYVDPARFKKLYSEDEQDIFVDAREGTVSSLSPQGKVIVRTVEPLKGRPVFSHVSSSRYLGNGRVLYETELYLPGLIGAVLLGTVLGVLVDFVVIGLISSLWYLLLRPVYRVIAKPKPRTALT